uniref:Uncharacterized protein n=1 Tax=Anopheles farauti TaxID=69004 RepID=A0A182Q549_9DIPT
MSSQIWCYGAVIFFLSYYNSSLGIIHNGHCKQAETTADALDMICRNITTTVTLRAFRYEPLENIDNNMLHNLFRIEGANWSCMKLTVHCGSRTFALNCGDRSGHYAIVTSRSNQLPAVFLTGTHNYNSSKKCEHSSMQQLAFEGHVQRYILIRFCLNFVRTTLSLIGYWVFVPHANPSKQNEEIMRFLYHKYPYFMAKRSVSAASGNGHRIWWMLSSKKQCDCDLYDRYIQLAARCKTPPLVGPAANAAHKLAVFAGISSEANDDDFAPMATGFEAPDEPLLEMIVLQCVSIFFGACITRILLVFYEDSQEELYDI